MGAKRHRVLFRYELDESVGVRGNPDRWRVVQRHYHPDATPHITYDLVHEWTGDRYPEAVAEADITAPPRQGVRQMGQR